MKCPYCNKRDCVDDRVYSNMANYQGGGTESYTVPCTECDRMLYVRAESIIKITDIEKSDAERCDSDFYSG